MAVRINVKIHISDLNRFILPTSAAGTGRGVLSGHRKQQQQNPQNSLPYPVVGDMR